MVWMAAWLFLAQAFWQAKPPGEWNDLELAQFMANSPWAQMAVPASKDSSINGIPAYLATAGPVQKAVAERTRRAALRAHVDLNRRPSRFRKSSRPGLPKTKLSTSSSRGGW